MSRIVATPSSVFVAGRRRCRWTAARTHDQPCVYLRPRSTERNTTMKKFRTAIEEEVGRNIERIFDACPDPVEVRLDNFPKYVRRQQLKRFVALYEVLKLVLPVKGSVIDCGVFRGFSLMTWSNLIGMFEPENLTRRVNGFDSLLVFTSVSD